MDYKGKLYGKIAGKYFDTGKTAEDFDALENKVKNIQKSKFENLKKPFNEIELRGKLRAEFEIETDDVFIKILELIVLGLKVEK